MSDEELESLCSLSGFELDVARRDLDPSLVAASEFAGAVRC